MSFGMHYATQAYSNIGVETSVPGADPHQLILMLFEGAQLAIGNAKRHMADGEIAAKGTAISKAIMIIDDGLRASLDVEQGGRIAQNLRSLYEYMSRRLLVAGAKNDPALLDEVYALLGELKSAWASIEPAKAAATGSTAATRTAARSY